MRLRFCAVPGMCVRDPDAVARTGDLPRYLGRQYDPAVKPGSSIETCFPVVAEGFEVEAGTPKARHCEKLCKQGALKAMNEAAAKRSGVKLEAKAPSKAMAAKEAS